MFEHKLFLNSVFDELRKQSLYWFDNIPAVQHKITKNAAPEAVTLADIELEKYLTNALQKKFPDIKIFGEESSKGNHTIPSGKVFVIDPIDGTKSFCCGLHNWSILLAMIENGRAIFSVVDFPCLNKRYMASADQKSADQKSTDQKAELNNKTLKQPNTKDLTLENAKLGTTSLTYFSSENIKGYQKVSEKALISVEGGDASLYASLAEGNLNLIIEEDLKPFDYLPLMPLVRAQGGVIEFAKDNVLITASNDALWHQACKVFLQA